MQIFERIAPLRAWRAEYRCSGQTIGLVPTMGYLHEGHLSLIGRARKDCDVVVVSIFVNPIQFGPGEDLARYPRDFDRDSTLCQELGVDAIFHPKVEEMYPSGKPLTTVHVAEVTSGLCGRSRPTHFAGVATVVAKLFGILEPDVAYFGEKDFQQLVAIRTMVRDLSFPVEIVGCEIVREPDGLAMSSRNEYLSKDERVQAPVLYRALCKGRDLIERGERDALAVSDAVRALIATADLGIVDYIEVVHPATLQPLKRIEDTAVIAAAVRFESARLIDNVTARQE